MKIQLHGHQLGYDFRNIVSIFMPPESCQIIEASDFPGAKDPAETLIAPPPAPMTSLFSLESFLIDREKDNQRVLKTELYAEGVLVQCFSAEISRDEDPILLKKRSKRILVRQLYEILRSQMKPRSKWGVLVGVRPTKLGHELLDHGHSDDTIREILVDDYYVDPEKANLLLEICHLERSSIYPLDENRFSIYLSIPFCPTRCLYCSFPSYAVTGREKDVDRYTDVLIEELVGNGRAMKGKQVDTIYFGGGTPAVLSVAQIERIVGALKANYDLSTLREFTFEAGRPDAIEEPLLDALKRLGVGRVCVNPQTMDDRTLELIGRKHNVEQTVRAMALVKQKHFDAVNMDLIVGLPEETLSDAKRSIDSVLALKPENITVHTLAIKRSSRLNRERDHYELPSESQVEDMLRVIDKEVRAQGYVPYYMYRQKYMLGNLENVGYTLPGKASIYNMFIMEEKQTILAFGAGATSKCFFPHEDRFERVPNVKSLEDYLGRVQEMVKRKNDILLEV